jgi:heptosyltransferase-2
MQRELAARLRREGYGQSLVMPRTWKGGLAPFLAGIPVRTGHLGEFRYGLLNDVRYNEKQLPRMIDQCAALALPAKATLPAAWPEPQLVVPAADIAAWRQRRGLTDTRRVVALAPGAVGPSKRWTSEGFGAVAAEFARQGFAVWILGGPGEKALVAEINAHAGGVAQDLTGMDLRDAIIALAAADAALSNDSGLLHVAAAIGTPTVGVFGPTSPWLWAPLNPLAGVIETTTDVPCRPCHKPTCALIHHRCMRDIGAGQVLEAMSGALAVRS